MTNKLSLKSKIGSRRMLILLLVMLALFAWQYYIHETSQSNRVAIGQASTSAVQAAFVYQRSGVWLEAQGTVQRVLPDDNDGSRHQRFILDVGSGHTLLVSHNIDLAERVPAVVGDSLALRGRYEWNERGGVIHWTHHDPAGREQGGWIRKDGKRYQ